MAVFLIDTLVSILFSFLIPPFIGIVLVLVMLAGLGKTLGIRQKYVDILLEIFEFGKQRLAKKEKMFSPEPLDTIEEDEPHHRNGITDIIFKSDDKFSNCETHEFQFSDSLDYLCKGVEAIVDDEVTKRFAAEELTSWNFLTRTNANYEFISMRLTVFWGLGFLFRYFVLLPIRICILFIGVGFLVTVTTLLAIIPEGPTRQVVGRYSFLTAFRIIGRAISAVVNYHFLEHKPRSDGICVANHTSPIDCVILASDNVYGFVGQRHGGFLGIFQRALSRASDHIWFERGETKDRFAVARRLREHVEDHNKMPILIFPEGTCINNTSVMQFKKGTFEVGGVIYPVAIKYDPRFGDAFWNSSKFAMLNYIFMMMTSWAIVCDVWYLPPMERLESESSIQFANRVKAEIARRGGLVDLVWDGGLKRSAPKKEFKKQYQQDFSRTLKLHETADTETDKEMKDQMIPLLEGENDLNKDKTTDEKPEKSKSIAEVKNVYNKFVNQDINIDNQVINNFDSDDHIITSNVNNSKDNTYSNFKCSSEKLNLSGSIENGINDSSNLVELKCGKME